MHTKVHVQIACVSFQDEIQIEPPMALARMDTLTTIDSSDLKSSLEEENSTGPLDAPILAVRITQCYATINSTWYSGT